jgi:hypothetical protein
MIFRPWRAANSSSCGRRAIVPSSFMISQMTAEGLSPAMRARSTDASVCPGRTSTPPFLARRGKTCPGRARSCGRVLESTAVRMVVARSDALMPVVTPLRASMETVKAVPKKEVLSATCIVRCSSSQRSSVRGMQMRPRACVAMKLTWSGVTSSAAQTRSPSFSRSSSSTMMIMRPSRMSAAASSMEAKGIGSGLKNQLWRALAVGAYVTRNRPFWRTHCSRPGRRGARRKKVRPANSLESFAGRMGCHEISFYGLNLCRYSVESRNALTISART